MKTDKDNLGNRIKNYENIESLRKLDPSLPVIIRLDGKAFHSFTRGLQKPYDKRLQNLMQTTTQYMVEKTNASLGYTQSDEISLVIITQPESEVYFGGRVQKLCSILAAACSVQFNALLPSFLPEKVKFLPIFDCRVFNVPTLWEAANTILWREKDAIKNSISVAAQSMFSHKSLDGLHSSEKIEKMLKEKNVNWHDYPDDFKHGSFFRRIISEIPFTQKEISELPEKHQARKNPNILVKRTKIVKIDLPDLKTIANLPEVLFTGSDILLK